MMNVLNETLPRLFVGLFLFGLFSLASASELDEKAPSDSAWTPVSLPFRPTGVAGTETTLWVCGVNEMLAKSDDGGKTWIVKHKKPDGEVLLTVGILNENTVYASGTNGLLLWSDDSGETWKYRASTGERVLDSTFSDAMHGIRHTRSGVQITKDGGGEWTDVSILKSDDLRDYSNVLGVAALDSNHLAMIIKKTQGENLFVSTQDGGATWKPLHLEDTYASRLFVQNGEFWAFGMEILERKKGGGYGAPLVLHSADGLQWTHGTKSPWEFSSCTIQGCVLYDGAIVMLYHAKPEYLAFPADKTLTSNWVISKGGICTLASSLKCSSAKTSDDLPPRPVVRGPIRSSLRDDFSELVPECLICPLDPFPVSKSLLGTVSMTVIQPGQQVQQIAIGGLKTDVEVEYQVRKDGLAERVKVRGAAHKEIESGLLQQIAAWVLEPSGRGTSRAEDVHKIKLTVFCDAFEPGDKATCMASIFRKPGTPSDSN